MAPMTDFERERARAWLKERRGAMSQAALAEDITQVMEWTITRDRYSKYESGGTDFGPTVLRKFIGYWATKGKTGPDFAPPPAVEPAPDLATALLTLTQELAGWRAERAAWERGVLAALAATEGPARAALLASLAPQPLEGVQP